MLRITLLLLLFTGLTALGIWYASPDPEALRVMGARAATLTASTWLGLGFLAFALIAVEMLRFHVAGRAIGVRIDLKTQLDATVATNFFSWISPFAVLGDPATIFMLARQGIAVDAAALVTFGKFATSWVFILGAAGGLIAAGYGPPVSPWVLGPFAAATVIAAAILAAILAGAFAPRAANAAIDRWLGQLPKVAAQTRSAVTRLENLRRGGVASIVLVLVGHALYYGVFIGILLILAAAFGAEEPLAMLPNAIIYQAFLYIAPTPGGAGLGELTAAAFFDAYVPAGGALTVVVLFRALTFYFQILVGLIYLPLTGINASALASKRRDGTC